MKINFQKIFIVISAVCVICCFAVPVSATDSYTYETIMDLKYQYEREYLNLLRQYESDNITYDEFKNSADEIIERYKSLPSNLDDNGALNSIAENTVNAITDITEGIGEAISKTGDVVKDWISDIFNDYEEETSSTTDLLGYGAMLERKNVIGSNGDKMYAEYIELRLRDDGGYDIYVPGPRRVITEYYGGSDKIVTGAYIITYNPENHKLYGDIRYSDGSKAPSDDEYVTDSIVKFDELSNEEIDELIDELQEELKRQNPDLSNIEGLLEAIYYRLGALDSDNDNDLLSQVLVAIQSLETTGDNTELIDILNDIKDSLTDGNDNTEDENEELTDELEKHLTVGDFVIDDDMYRNYSEVLKLRLQEKFIFTDELKELITYTVNSYSNSSENPQLSLSYDGNTYSMDFSAFNEHIPAIRFIIAAFTYITFAFRTYRKIPSYINGGDNL